MEAADGEATQRLAAERGAPRRGRSCSVPAAADRVQADARGAARPARAERARPKSAVHTLIADRFASHAGAGTDEGPMSGAPSTVKARIGCEPKQTFCPPTSFGPALQSLELLKDVQDLLEYSIA
jgi:hypothetical protein